jgi:uncharacterized surface protein with fasciclin (FAS1) repeats
MDLKGLLSIAAAASLISTAALAQAPAAPPAAPPAATQAPPTAPATGDIIATAKASGQFSILLQALEATNLTKLLQDKNYNLTLFAPTDAAFRGLPAGELDKLMLPENKASLQKLLTYHLVNTRIDSSKMKNAKGPVPTAANTPLEVDGSGDQIMVNDGQIIRADIAATNGIIHAIDRVLAPGLTQPPAASAAAPAAPASGANSSATAPAQRPAGPPPSEPRGG